MALQLMVQGDIVTAGAAIRHLCDLGFDEDGVRHKVVAWCPQVLTMSQVSYCLALLVLV